MGQDFRARELEGPILAVQELSRATACSGTGNSELILFLLLLNDGHQAER